MAEKIANIAKNTSFFTLALIIQKVISFSYFTVYARELGPSDLGTYYFALAFTAIFSIFIDIGLNNVLTREVARDSDNAARALSIVIIIKLPLAIFTALALFFTLNWLHFHPTTQALVWISLMSVILDSFTGSFYAVSRGFHNLKFESFGSVVYQTIVLLFSLLVLAFHGGLIFLICSLLSASIFNFVYSLIVLIKKWHLKLILKFDWLLLKPMLLIALPFGIYALLQRFYTYFDTVILNFFSGPTEVGIYQIAFKIIFALQFLPLAFTASLYPALSLYWRTNRPQLAITYERALNYLAIIAWPIAIGIIALSDQIIKLFKSGFTGAILPLEINMIGLIFMFLNYPGGSLLNACDRQNRNTLNMGLTFIASILLNLGLIPRWGAVGASITVAVTNFILFALNFYATHQILAAWPRNTMKVLGKVILASIVMGLTTYWFKASISIFVVVILSAVIYFAILYLLKAFRREDIFSILHSFSKKT